MHKGESMGSESLEKTGAAVYEKSHHEIFNPIEQRRLYSTLREATNAVQTGSKPPAALDYGCGSGNLTRHLTELGFHVTAADVSDDFLSAIERKFSGTGMVKAIKLNGADLSDVPDARFDLVATYSVLHHVPDYLRIVVKVRSTRPPQPAWLSRTGEGIEVDLVEIGLFLIEFHKVYGWG